jgi:hypothetical protein
MKTTIAISTETREEINNLKVHPRQTCEEIIKKLISGETNGIKNIREKSFTKDKIQY